MAPLHRDSILPGITRAVDDDRGIGGFAEATLRCYEDGADGAFDDS